MKNILNQIDVESIEMNKDDKNEFITFLKNKKFINKVKLSAEEKNELENIKNNEDFNIKNKIFLEDLEEFIINNEYEVLFIRGGYGDNDSSVSVNNLLDKSFSTKILYNSPIKGTIFIFDIGGLNSTGR